MLWLYILFGIVGFFALLYCVGFFLPSIYETKLGAVLNKAPEEVWAALTDYQKHPVTGPMRRKTEPLPEVHGLPAWVEDMGQTRITVTTVEARAPAKLVREMKDQVVPMTARHEVTLERLENGTSITAMARTEIRSGTWHVPIFRLVITLTRGGGSNLKRFWVGLAKSLNADIRWQ